MMQDTNENEIKQSPARTSGQNVGENETPLESESFGAVSKRFLKALINYIRGLTVEPIIFLIYLGWIFGNTLQSYGIYERICETHFEDGNEILCENITDESVEDAVQQKIAEWYIFNIIAYLVPAIFADTFLGAYGDVRGRKVNIIFGIVGVAITEFGYLLTLSKSVRTPFWTVLIFNFLGGTTGYITLVPISCNAYLADIISDPGELTIRSGLFSVFQTIASVIGGIAAALLPQVSPTVAIDIELCLFLFALIYALWRIPQQPSKRELQRRYASSQQLPLPEKKKLLVQVIELLKDGFNEYRKKRKGHRRAFIFIAVIALMLTYTTWVETRTSLIIDGYVFRRVSEGSLAWTPKDLGFWNGTGFLMLIVGTLSGLYLFKYRLKCRETTLILIAITSSTARSFMLAFATDGWHMYLANAFGLFGGLMQPATVSFISQMVSSDEIGKAFSLLGITGDIMFLLTSVLYTTIYRQTEPWMPGFTFISIGCLHALAGISMVWVHIYSKKEGIGLTRRPRKRSVLRQAISRIGFEESDTSGKGGSEKVSPMPHPVMKQMSIYEAALERERDRLQDDSWWGSLTLMRKSDGSFY